VYNYNRDSILVLVMYGYRCKFLGVSYVNVFYMVVEANFMNLGDYAQIQGLQEAGVTAVGLVIMLLKDFSLWLPIIFVAIKTVDRMNFWWWILLLRGSVSIVTTTCYTLYVAYLSYQIYNPQTEEASSENPAIGVSVDIGEKQQAESDASPTPPEATPEAETLEPEPAPPPGPPPGPPPPGPSAPVGRSGNAAFESMFNPGQGGQL